MTVAMPGVRPTVPHFSSGPCAKRPGWTPQNLSDAALGRSHRAKIGKAKLKHAIELTREVLGVPADYKIGIVPASDTGAVEMALWSLLGARPVTMLAWETFGEGWVTDVQKQLKLQGRHRAQGAATANCRISPRSISTSDVVFTWNGTTSGVRVPNADWIKADREGLDDLRRDLRCFRAGARLRQARCGHLLLAEGAGRRGRARHADPVAARGRSGSKATSRPGRCRRSSA